MGKLIVIEGTDGCGKKTQLELLARRLKENGTDFRTLDFPRYDKQSSALVKMYLGGQFGREPGDVNAFAASTFFAVDRYASYKCDWEQYYRSGGILISNRYTTSNATHQGSKLSESERETYYEWLYDFEFRLLGLPRPELVVLLDVPVDITHRLIAQRRISGAGTDIHEEDLRHLTASRESGLHAARVLGWRVIDCVRDGALRSREEIHEEICALAFETINA